MEAERSGLRAVQNDFSLLVAKALDAYADGADTAELTDAFNGY